MLEKCWLQSELLFLKQNLIFWLEAVRMSTRLALQVWRVPETFPAPLFYSEKWCDLSAETKFEIKVLHTTKVRDAAYGLPSWTNALLNGPVLIQEYANQAFPCPSCDRSQRAEWTVNLKQLYLCEFSTDSSHTKAKTTLSSSFPTLKESKLGNKPVISTFCSQQNRIRTL